MRKITLIRIEMACRVSSAHSLFECERGDELRVERFKGDEEAHLSAVDADHLLAEGYAEDITPRGCCRQALARERDAVLLQFDVRRNTR